MRESIEQLLGIVSGIVADDDVHDLEIEFLKVWLGEHADVARVWPGIAIGRAIDTVLADGHVSEEERSYLMDTLKQLASGDLAFDGPDTATAFALPLDNVVEIALRDSLVCLTGDFLHWTKAACERLLEQAGGWPTGTVSKNVHYLVVGAKVPPNSMERSHDHTIKEALALQQAGHGIAIISEQRWLESIAARMAS